MTRDSADLFQALGRRIRSVAARRASLQVALVGPVGIGKTHLARRLAREAGVPTVLLGEAAPEAPQVRAGTPTAAPGSGRAPSLTALATLPGGPRWAQRALEDAALDSGGLDALVQAALAALLGSAPLVVVVDHLETLGERERALWPRVAEALRGTRGVALIITTREPAPPPFEPVTVAPLDESEVRALLTGEVGGALPDAAVRWIGQRALGNPLFTLEYSRFLHARGALWSDGSGWHWRPPELDGALPHSLEGLVSEALGDVLDDEAARRTLGAFALLPAGTPAGLREHASGLPRAAFTAAWARLSRRRVLDGEAFTHPLYADVVRRQLPDDLTRALARRALDALRQQPGRFGVRAAQAALLAGPLLRPAGAAAYEACALLVRVGVARRALGDEAGAARAFGEASAVTASAAQRAGLARRAAEGLAGADLPMALHYSGVAWQNRPGDEEIGLLRAELLSRAGERAQAQDVVEALGKTVMHERWLPRLIALRTQQADFVGVVELWRGSAELQRGAPPLTLRDVAWSLMFTGELAAASRLYAQALSAPTEGRERGLLLVARAQLLVLQGEAANARADVDEAVTLLQRAGRPAELARALEARAEVGEHAGWFAQSARDAHDALTLRQDLGDGLGVARASLRLAAAVTELADYPQAERLLHEGLGLQERAASREGQVVWHCQLAYLYLEWTAPHARTLALKHARRAEHLARQGIGPVYLNTSLAHAAWAEARFGDPARAVALADEAIAVADQSGQADSTAIELLARALARERQQDLEAARADLEEAITQLRAAGLTAAERFALELDRLNGDARSAARRLAHFEARGHRHAAALARLYFPGLADALGGGPAPAQPREALHLRILGPFGVERDQRPVRLHSRLSRVFLARLLLARLSGTPEVPDLALFDLLWSDLPEDKAQHALKQLVYRLRLTLGPDAVWRGRHGYLLGNVSSDAELFLQASRTALWRGPYLADLPDLEGGEDLRAAVLEALLRAAHAALTRDEREALRLGRILMASDPYDEQALALTLRALSRLGRRRDLSSVYALGRARFQEVGLDLPPSPTAFLDRWPLTPAP